MADCNAAATLSEIATKDTNRIVGSIAKCLAANSPYVNVLAGGVFPSGVSDTVRSVVQMPAAPGDSLAAPTFSDDTTVCGTKGLQDLTDTVEFTYKLQSKRGTGPRVCVKKGYSAFKESYLRSEDALAKLITQYINADIRNVMTNLSASKFSCLSTNTFAQNFVGGDFTNISEAFAGTTVPDGKPTFKTLHTITRYMREALFAEMFPAGDKGQMHFKVIADSELIEQWRNETGVNNVLIALTTGGYKLGETALTGYAFETAPAYRGLAFATDQRGLRGSAVSAGGVVTLVNPVSNQVNSDGTLNRAYGKANPSWVTADYGIFHIIADNTFERQVPERFVGEGSFKFAPQLHMGELDWHYQMDSDCNIFGDFGFHKYQITRAYRPIRPQHVVSVLYKRTGTNLTDLASY